MFLGHPKAITKPGSPPLRRRRTACTRGRLAIMTLNNNHFVLGTICFPIDFDENTHLPRAVIFPSGTVVANTSPCAKPTVASKQDRKKDCATSVMW